MPSEVIAARIPDHLNHTLTLYATDKGMKKSAVMVNALESFLANATAKVRPTPLGAWTNPHSAQCAAVYRALQMGPLTTSEISRKVGKSTNNCSRRVKDLADAGYVEMTGQRRKSLDSGYMLDVWKCTSKRYEEGKCR